jgi:hypothetical protein
MPKTRKPAHKTAPRAKRRVDTPEIEVSSAASVEDSPRSDSGERPRSKPAAVDLSDEVLSHLLRTERPD